MENILYYGDNLQILRNYIKDKSIDLIYLDPPFNSKASYNILYQEPTGEPSKAQVTVFEDTWHWTDETEKTFQEIISIAGTEIVEMMNSFRKFLRLNDMMAYLTMMCIRLIELKRVLKDTGAIFIHCDPTASHYIKILMDTIFGKKNFRNEIIWCKITTMYQSTSRFVPQHDTILYYLKDLKGIKNFNWKISAEPFSETTINKYKYIGENGRRFRLHGRNIKGSPIKNYTDVNIEWLKKAPDLVRIDYLDEKAGVKPKDWWTIDIINQYAHERMGYPTQKPETLLEKIIKCASKEGDLVLDPFCGCGTTIAVAQRLNRNWIGIDITHLAINLIKGRLASRFNLKPKKDFIVIGEPEDLSGANELAQQNRYQFQWWALSLINARPYGEKKRGADLGVDGIIFLKESEKEIRKVIIQVKSGKVQVRDIRELSDVVEREKAVIGILITLQEPTRPMELEAIEKGFYQSKITKNNYRKIQILTIKEIMEGVRPHIPENLCVFPYKKSKKFIDSNQNAIL